MVPASIVELADVSGKPRVKMGLPSPLRVGDKIQLRLHLTRQVGGRSEVLDVSGEFQVRTVAFDVSTGVAHQILSVNSGETTPAWKAVKKGALPSTAPRKLGPARAPSTDIE